MTTNEHTVLFNSKIASVLSAHGEKSLKLFTNGIQFLSFLISEHLWRNVSRYVKFKVQLKLVQQNLLCRQISFRWYDKITIY